MEGKAICGMLLSLLLIGSVTLGQFDVRTVDASGTVYIRSDGSVDPPTAPIQRDGDVYNLTDNIYDSIFVQRDNIVVDGSGHLVQGAGVAMGLYISGRRNVTIKNMEIKGFWRGVSLSSSSNITLLGNSITDNGYGIELSWSSYNVLSGNSMADNRYNFMVLGHDPPQLIHQIDASNTIDNRPFYYLVNESNREVPSDAGSFVAVYSKNITAKNLNVTRNGLGVALFYCRNSTIKNVASTKSIEGIRIHHSHNIKVNNSTLSNNDVSIFIHSSSNVTFEDNRIVNSSFGLLMETHSFHINLIGNVVSNNSHGLGYTSASGVIRENNISDNGVGIDLFDAGYVRIYHNNFIGNQQHVEFHPGYTGPTSESWNNGREGNYWSNYSGSDLDLNGIGDTPHIIAQVDYTVKKDEHPLMGMFRDFEISYEEEIHHVTTVSNSTVSGFQFNQEERILSFNVVGSDYTFGFCRIGIPKALMNYTHYAVLVDGEKPLLQKGLPSSNTTYQYLYFTYSHSTRNVKIMGIIPVGDINDDDKVDVRDIAQAALAFGSYPEHPNWNPQSDMNQDGKVDIRDLVLIAVNLGKTYL